MSKLDDYFDYLDKGELGLAEYVLLKALIKDPTYIDLRYERSKLFAQLHRLKECLEELELIDRLQPNYKDVKLGIEIVKERLTMVPYF